MKTLIKNRRCYKNRIGSLDDEQEIKKEEGEKEDHDGTNGDNYENNDDWDNMYVSDKSDVDGDGDGGEDKGNNGEGSGEDEDENGGVFNGGEDEDGNDGKEMSGSCGKVGRKDKGNNGAGGGEDEDESGGDKSGGEDEDGNDGKEISSSRGKVGRKDNEGRAGMKRKSTVTQYEVTATSAKRSKMDGSKGHQEAAQSKKKQPKRKSGKKD
jgi:hypothetical protein